MEFAVLRLEPWRKTCTVDGQRRGQGSKRWYRPGWYQVENPCHRGTNQGEIPCGCSVGTDHVATEPWQHGTKWVDLRWRVEGRKNVRSKVAVRTLHAGWTLGTETVLPAVMAAPPRGCVSAATGRESAVVQSRCACAPLVVEDGSEVRCIISRRRCCEESRPLLREHFRARGGPFTVGLSRTCRAVSASHRAQGKRERARGRDNLQRSPSRRARPVEETVAPGCGQLLRRGLFSGRQNGQGPLRRGLHRRPGRPSSAGSLVAGGTASPLGWRTSCGWVPEQCSGSCSAAGRRCSAQRGGSSRTRLLLCCVRQVEDPAPAVRSISVSTLASAASMRIAQRGAASGRWPSGLGRAAPSGRRSARSSSPRARCRLSSASLRASF